jgi:tRNA(fMet)-specific endonuclease VapC
LAFLLDTDVMIWLRDGDEDVWQRLRALDPPFAISAISRVELENGVYRDGEWTSLYRQSLDVILDQVATLDFGRTEIEAYRAIVETGGFSKRKVSDRMTAATALVHDLTLVTMNGRDFGDIPGLKLLAWPNPAA